MLLSSSAAEAHVKWFVDHDVSTPPMPIGEVLTGTFVKMFLVAVACTYLFFLADRYIHEKGYLVKFDESLKRFDGFATYVMRISAGIFFLSLWVWYLYHGSTFYITPELKTRTHGCHGFTSYSHSRCHTCHYPITGLGFSYCTLPRSGTTGSSTCSTT